MFLACLFELPVWNGCRHWNIFETQSTFIVPRPPTLGLGVSGEGDATIQHDSGELSLAADPPVHRGRDLSSPLLVRYGY